MFENRIGEAGAKALFDEITAQLLEQGFMARGGQIIDTTRIPSIENRGLFEVPMQLIAARLF